VWPKPVTSHSFKVGILSFSDGRLRVHNTLADTIQRQAVVLAKAIEGETPADDDGIACDRSFFAGCPEMAREVRGAGADVALLTIQCACFPELQPDCGAASGYAVALCSPKDGALPGLGGIMAAHGEFRQEA